jgi:hypothetical protein
MLVELLDMIVETKKIALKRILEQSTSWWVRGEQENLTHMKMQVESSIERK